MEDKWNNNDFKNKISSFYSNFKNDFKSIIDTYCGTNNFKILQVYPNKFQFSSFQIEFFLTEKSDDVNSIKIEFPKVNFHNDELFFFGTLENRDSDQKIFSSILSQNFDQKNFRFELSEIFNRFHNSYKLLVHENFTEIRDNYFVDIGRKLLPSELKMFDKPAVLIKCEVTRKLSDYGYKPGEGRNYVHSYFFKHMDVHNFNDVRVQSYLDELNLSKPIVDVVEHYEISPRDNRQTLVFTDFDLDLSAKINWYIKLNRENDNKYDYIKNIVLKPSFGIRNDNFDFFESLVIIYVITKFDISAILIYLSNDEIEYNQSYCNLILFSQYFLNKKYSYYNFLDGYNSLRDITILELRKNNSRYSTYDQICSSFEKIGGSANDLVKLKYLYINYTNTNKNREINYDVLFFIIREYFKG